MFWITNTSGRKDAILTISIVGFAMVLLKMLLGGVSLEMAGHTISFGNIDAAVIGAILGPTLGAYVIRRYTDKKYHGKVEKDV